MEPEPSHSAAKTNPEEGKPPLRARLGQRLTRMMLWATGTRLRLAMASLLGLTTLGVIFGVWSYYGQLTIEAVNPDGVKHALAALDEERYEDAKSIIGQVQQLAAENEILGSALYVLGAVKIHEADLEPSAERRRLTYEVASRYLQKAMRLGIEPKRQDQATFLLGKSLALSGQTKPAIAMLEELVHGGTPSSTAIHALLVTAHLQGVQPNLAAALKHNQQVLADESLDPAARLQAWIINANALVRLDRHEAARASLAEVAAGGALEAERLLLLGRIEVEEAELLEAGDPERSAKLTAARDLLQQVAAADQDHGPLTRQAALWLAYYHELNHEHQAAVAEYEGIIKNYPDSPEALTATLATADYLQRDGQMERALAGYCAVLRAINAQVAYDDSVLPLADVRRRMEAAYQQCITQELFGEALTLVDLFESVFGSVTSMELRAKTHQLWGARMEHEHGGASDMAAWQSARFQLRAAGRAFEDLARLRFAARQFADDLWNGAECYFQGQSFTSAARLYDEYLHHEARRRNALALLRLGQAQLAGRAYEQSMAALQECVEMYPRDAISHQARLEWARAYEQQGKLDQAEELLLTNLVGDVLTPASPEWRDSLFELGNLLYAAKRYDEAIGKLQEGVERYPEHPGALLARYVIARSYHAQSDEAAKRLAESKTDNERQSARLQLTELLSSAHENYQAVQRKLTLRGGADAEPLDRALLQNCYLMQGSVLFELRRFDEALKAYGNVITLYQSEPIALESFVQVANCWRRLDQPVKARVTLDQAKQVLKEIPPETDFLATTNFSRQQWEFLLNQMSQW